MGEVVTLDGTVIRQGGRRIVKVRRLLRSNVPKHLRLGVVETQQDEEWAAYDQLPEPIREVLREEYPFDQTALAVLSEWRRAQLFRNASVDDFVRYMRAVAVSYTNMTMDVWDVPPPILGELPTWHR